MDEMRQAVVRFWRFEQGACTGYPKEKAARLGVMDWTEPPAEAVGQVNAYAADLLRRYPDLTITRHVVCTISATEFRFFAQCPVPPMSAVALAKVEA